MLKSNFKIVSKFGKNIHVIARLCCYMYTEVCSPAKPVLNRTGFATEYVSILISKMFFLTQLSPLNSIVNINYSTLNLCNEV